MKKLMLFLLLMCLAAPAFSEGATFGYRYADADEAAKLLLSNRSYYENLSQNDLNFRMQKLDATLEELEAFAAEQTLNYTDAEKAVIDGIMSDIEAICRERGYNLPATDGIVFAKTTMHEECDAGGYTHGTQIYLGEAYISATLAVRPALMELVAHELFHCLTRNHPEFRRAMYGILGFTVAEEDYAFPQSVRDVMISNPDVGHHNASAAFDIGGEMRDCVVIFTTGKPFEKPGDSFFDNMVTGLVPVDDPGALYTSADAANFWDVFGRNTQYVIDPEETLADNFAYTFVYGLEAKYPSPEIVQAIDACLKGEAVQNAA